MDTSDDLDELPEIILDCSMAETEKSISFEMPDASVIAAQRKLGQQQEEEIKRFQDESLLETSDEVPTELLEDVKKVPVVMMPEEQPGLDLSELDRADVVGDCSGARSVLLMELMDKLPDCGSAEIADILDWYLDSIHLTTIENPSSFECEDIHCNVIAMSLLYLDRKCRKCVDTIKLQDTVLDLLNRTGKPHQSQTFLQNLTKHLLKIVEHFHNRIALAQLFNNANVNGDKPEQFSRKLSMAITIHSLSQLLGYSKQVYNENITVGDLRDIVMHGCRWTMINPYEQYGVLIMVMNILKTYSVMENSDATTLKELVAFLSTIRSNEKWNNGEFLKVKNLVSKTKLFVQSKQYQTTQSPRKTPLKQMRLNE